MTGASRGIGAATAERLRRDGWQVETAERATGVDLSDPGAARRAVDGLERIDALVANAAAHVRKPALQTSLDEWQYLVDLNLTSVFVLAQAAARKMADQGGGSIVLLASMMSEVAGQGVRVNAVAPGYVETEMTSTIDDGRRREIDRRIPLGRWGSRMRSRTRSPSCCRTTRGT